MSATYLLLQSKKFRGKRIHLRIPSQTGHASTTQSASLGVSFGVQHNILVKMLLCAEALPW